MNKKKIRHKGILLGYTRIDKNFIRELWLWKTDKVYITIYDPSIHGIKDFMLNINPRKKKKIKRVNKEFRFMRKRYDRIRSSGDIRKQEKKLKTPKLVEAFITKRVAKIRKKKDTIKLNIFLEELSEVLGVKHKVIRKYEVKLYSLGTSIYTIRFSIVNRDLHLVSIKVNKKNKKISSKLVSYIVKAVKKADYKTLNIACSTTPEFWKKMRRKYPIIKESRFVFEINLEN